jgi:hypothetical protein
MDNNVLNLSAKGQQQQQRNMNMGNQDRAKVSGL